MILTAISAWPALAQQDDLTPQMPGSAPAGSATQLPTSTIPAADASGDLRSAPILTLDQDALYLSSDWGKRAQAQLEAEGDIIAAENERLTQLLSSEESRLTQQRATLPPADFRKLAESFDLRATEVRRERAQAVQQLNAWAEADRSAFFRAALPVMGQIMQDRGAVAVLDRRTLFVSLDAIDVTQDLVTDLNADLGDGKGVVPLPPEDGASGQAGDPVTEQVE
ncbi:MAG: OmpH family outer membrane protein [Paracoccus sp. (in: a-proteobacteria)]|nr:OmpH family outer membrane protein [Paracoccus sp. (in: a-proteobacteria)]